RTRHPGSVGRMGPGRHPRAGRDVRRFGHDGGTTGRRVRRRRHVAVGRAMTIRVVVVDDQPIVRAGFHTILDAQADIEVVGQPADGVEAVAAVDRLRPDVVVMDVRMPNLDGIAATRRIFELDASRATKVLVLTTFDIDDYVYEALRAGASGYLLKDA